MSESPNCARESGSSTQFSGTPSPFSSRRPRLLDLFCGAGGASRGYHDAGFEVVGVDIKPQPNYPFEFIEGDALGVLDASLSVRGGDFRYQFDAIHASPPCQAYTRAGVLRTEARNHPDLIGPTRELLEATGLPWVIENVPGAPLRDPVQVCATGFFPLPALDWELQRHRLFESNVPLQGTACRHTDKPTISVVGHGATKATRERLGRNPSIAEKRLAMGIDWMNRDELSEAIPPVYTRFVGLQLIQRALVRGRGVSGNRTRLRVPS